MFARTFSLSITIASAAAAATAQCVAPPSWSELTTSSEAVTAIAPDGAGGLYAGGTFTTIGGVAAARVARWNGSTWQALGSGIAGPTPGVSAVLRTANGTLFVGGTFTSAGGVPAANIAAWNGSSWSALGSGIGGFAVNRLVEMPNGDVVALGNFSSAGGVAANNIARWNGTTWSALGTGVTSPGGAMVTFDGDLIVGGSVAGLPGFVARWNGSTWTNVGNLSSMVPEAITQLYNGDLIACGYLTVQRWNGATWSVAGTLSGGNLTTAYDVARHPDGSAIVVGGFTTVSAGTATIVRGVARLDPTTYAWSDIGSNTALQPLGLAGLVGACEVLGDGRIWLCRAPALAGGSPRSVLEIAPGCPPSSNAYGAGCAGSGGPNVLVPAFQPWLGVAMLGVCTGLPAGSLSLGVWGLSTLNLPLSSVLPLALPGCTLLAFPDLLTAHVPTSGFASVGLVLPDTPSWAGNVIRLQVVTFEPGVAVTSSNGIEFVLGRL